MEHAVAQSDGSAVNIFGSRPRAWAVTMGFVAAIYTASALGGGLQRELSSRGLGELVSVSIFMVYIIACFYIIVIRLGRWALRDAAVLTAALAAIVYTAIRLAKSPYDLLHIVEYSLLAVLFHYALKFDVRTRLIYMLSWALAAASGAADEVIQSFIPERIYAVNDMTIDAISAAVALAVLGFVVEERKAWV